MTWVRNLTASGLRNLKRDRLVAAYIQLSGVENYVDGITYPCTKKDLIAHIEDLLRVERDNPTPRAKPGRRLPPGQLTADECNEFLRSLPPMPLHGG